MPAAPVHPVAPCPYCPWASPTHGSDIRDLAYAMARLEEHLNTPHAVPNDEAHRSARAWAVGVLDEIEPWDAE